MDQKKAEALLAAIDSGSITKAAQQLNYTPSGISHILSALEEELGFPLLYRSKQGVVPTPNAQELLPVLRELQQTYNRFQQISSRISGLQQGTLVIGAYSSIAIRWLPAIIKDFQAQYPGIRVVLKEGIHQELEQLLETNQIDLCLYSRPRRSARPWVPLKTDPMIAVLPKDHPCSKESAYLLRHCEKEDFIMPAYGADYDVLELFRTHDLHPKIKYETIGNFSLLAMIAEGLGMSIMNRLITEGMTADVVKLPLSPHAEITLGASFPSWESLSPAAKAFLDCASSHLR